MKLAVVASRFRLLFRGAALEAVRISSLGEELRRYRGGFDSMVARLVASSGNPSWEEVTVAVPLRDVLRIVEATLGVDHPTTVELRDIFLEERAHRDVILASLTGPAVDE